MPEYDAFISYAHGSDAGLGHALQSSLERLAKPWYRTRASRVFLDSSNLSASPALWPSIEDALGSSRWFILLASADAATSGGVDREVRWWLEHREPERILVVAAGPGLAWNDAQADWAAEAPVPPALRGVFGHEPLWVDLTGLPPTGRRPTLPADRVAAVAAPVRGVQKDQLVGEHLRAHRGAIRLARAAVAVLATLTILAVAGGLLALRERDTAIGQRNQAQSDALAAESETLDDTDPSTAALLAADAYQIAPTSQAQASLLDVLAQPDRGVINTNGPGGAPSMSVNAVAFGRHGPVLATATDDSVRLWNTADRDQVGKPLTDADQDETDAVAFNPAGTLLAAAFDSGEAMIWSVPQQKRTGPALSCSDASPDALAFSPDGKLLAVVTQAGTVQLWHTRTWTADGAPFRMKSGGIQAVTFSPRGRLLATSTGSAVQLWRLASHSPYGSPMPSGSGATASVAFSPDGAVLAAAADGGGAQLWEVATQTRLGKPVADAGVTDVAFSPDGQILATAETDGPAQLWSVKTRAEIGVPLAAATGGVNAVAFGNSTVLATGSTDGTARLWDTAVRRQQAVLASGVSYHGVAEVAFSPSGNRLATAPSLLTDAVQTWNLGASSPNSRSVGTSGYGLATYVAFSASGHTLATVGMGGQRTEFWNPATGQANGHPPDARLRRVDRLQPQREAASHERLPDPVVGRGPRPAVRAAHAQDPVPRRDRIQPGQPLPRGGRRHGPGPNLGGREPDAGQPRARSRWRDNAGLQSRRSHAGRRQRPGRGPALERESRWPAHRGATDRGGRRRGRISGLQPGWQGNRHRQL